MNYEEMSIKQLRELAKELGVLPSGRPNKAALIKALQPGAPPTANTPEEQWSQRLYQYDTFYDVVEPFNGYEKGDVVHNLPRTLGLMMVEEGKIKLNKSMAPKSNPNAIARPIPQEGINA